MKAIIIGSGIAGIATAIRLRKKGYEVTVYEASNQLGGKLGLLESNGYRWDTGPSLFTMPHYIDELFELCNKNPRDYFNYQKLNIACEYFYSDGTHFTAYSQVEQLAQELHEKFQVEKQEVVNYFQECAHVYNQTGKIFLEKSLHKLSTWLSADVIKSILKLGKLDVNTTMHLAHAKKFSEPKIQQYLDRFATYNGSNPYQAPGILKIIPHLEHNIGTFFPDKGMRSIPESLIELAKSIGVEFHANSFVNKILVHKGKATGVQVNKTPKYADVIVSNMDVYPTYKKLLTGSRVREPKKVLAQPRSSSALIFYWGIKKSFKQLHVHNIFFSDSYQEEFNAIFNENKIIGDPTVYVHISSKAKPDDAPNGCENWFVMINVPNNNGQNWNQLAQNARTAILNKLSSMLGENIEALIETEHILDPVGIENNTSSYKGALYGAASNNKFAAFLRHKNFSSTVKGLYFCGGSVHPGGGIPLCLLSAKITSNLLPPVYE